jgi:hypothetical protein
LTADAANVYSFDVLQEALGKLLALVDPDGLR